MLGVIIWTHLFLSTNTNTSVFQQIVNCGLDTGDTFHLMTGGLLIALSHHNHITAVCSQLTSDYS